MKITGGIFYVYEHYIDGELFYIGKGQNDRAIVYEDRTPGWNKKVNGRIDDVRLKFVAYFDNNKDAENFERDHIKESYHQGFKLVNVEYNNNNILPAVRHRNKFIPRCRSITSERLTVHQIDRLINLGIKASDRILNTSMKANLSEEINIEIYSGETIKWTSIKKLLKENGFIIVDKVIRIEGKITRISIIKSQCN